VLSTGESPFVRANSDDTRPKKHITMQFEMSNIERLQAQLVVDYLLKRPPNLFDEMFCRLEVLKG
jgi:hypothetical protein